jgi:hypothetical protein
MSNSQHDFSQVVHTPDPRSLAAEWAVWLRRHSNGPSQPNNTPFVSPQSTQTITQAVPPSMIGFPRVDMPFGDGEEADHTFRYIGNPLSVPTPILNARLGRAQDVPYPTFSPPQESGFYAPSDQSSARCPTLPVEELAAQGNSRLAFSSTRETLGARTRLQYTGSLERPPHGWSARQDPSTQATLYMPSHATHFPDEQYIMVSTPGSASRSDMLHSEMFRPKENPLHSYEPPTSRAGESRVATPAPHAVHTDMDHAAPMTYSLGYSTHPHRNTMRHRPVPNRNATNSSAFGWQSPPALPQSSQSVAEMPNAVPIVNLCYGIMPGLPHDGLDTMAVDDVSLGMGQHLVEEDLPPAYIPPWERAEYLQSPENLSVRVEQQVIQNLQQGLDAISTRQASTLVCRQLDWRRRSSHRYGSASEALTATSGELIQQEPNQLPSQQRRLPDRIFHGSRRRAASRIHRTGYEASVAMSANPVASSQRRRRPQQAQLHHFTTVPAADMSDTPDCSICHDPYDDDEHPAIRLDETACTHVFGRPCLQEWVNSRMQNAHRCPSCRQSLSGALSEPPRANAPAPEATFDVGAHAERVEALLLGHHTGNRRRTADAMLSQPTSNTTYPDPVATRHMTGYEYSSNLLATMRSLHHE